MNKALCIIPARGGSKGLPHKNRLPLGGMPLIAHSIRLALHCDCFDHVMVSTDDPEIAAVALEYGAQVPFLRPSSLAGDRSSLTDVVQHAVQWYAGEGYHANVVGTMLPTSPFRTKGMVEKLTRKCLYEGVRSAGTVRRVELGRYVVPGGAGTPCRWLGDENKPWPGPYYRHYGAYQANRVIGNLPVEHLFIHRLRHPAELVDIDAPRDLVLAQRILEHNLYDFGYED